MKCSKCGANFAEDTELCPICGTKANAQEIVQQKVCPFCNSPVNEGSKFCSNCGATFNDSVDSSEADDNAVSEYTDSELDNIESEANEFNETKEESVNQPVAETITACSVQETQFSEMNNNNIPEQDINQNSRPESNAANNTYIPQENNSEINPFIQQSNSSQQEFINQFSKTNNQQNESLKPKEHMLPPIICIIILLMLGAAGVLYILGYIG